jgi:hypothetical protein
MLPLPQTPAIDTTTTTTMLLRPQPPPCRRRCHHGRHRCRRRRESATTTRRPLGRRASQIRPQHDDHRGGGDGILPDGEGLPMLLPGREAPAHVPQDREAARPPQLTGGGAMSRTSDECCTRKEGRQCHLHISAFVTSS